MRATLRLRSRGADVEELQRLLNTRMTLNPQLRVDGDFGVRTDTAVRQFQAIAGLGIDGVVGPRTWAALETRGSINHTPTTPVAATFPDASWMDIAVAEIGQSEIRGTQHNPRIIEYHATTGLGAQSDEIAWCSSFINWCLHQVGITGTNSAAAISWLRWGQSSTARAGAVAVIYNSSARNTSLSVSGNHVGFLVQESESHFRLLGGNQSNQVKISSYPKTAWQLKGYRWPIT